MARKLVPVLLILSTGLSGYPVFASIERTPRTNKSAMADRLVGLRSRVMVLEQSLIDSLKSQKQARANIKRIQEIMKLQKEERALGFQRMSELEKTIAELESRRALLKDRIHRNQGGIRQALIELNRSVREEPRSLKLAERERLEAPRRRVLGNLVDRGLKEIEAYRVDLADADQLESRIQEEKQQLAYLFQDLKEQEGVLELNRQLQVDILRKKHADRLAQLENYRKLKGAEAEVEKLIGAFNSRIELEKAVETERVVSKAMMQGAFARLKGQLPLPVPGRVVSLFGRSFDAKANLHVFKKGVEIATSRNEAVQAISAGKIAYAGELPNYGRIAIVDHGDHFYSLCGHLGKIAKKAGDPVAAGEVIGSADDAGTPIYFEIRARNIAVNPLQWVSN